ncbi:MAG: hypothetical protein EPO18_04960 [Methylobacter sp.]|nr:MAG: hypothetical protein EPO18_04960 [Methylobacter sp.]
MSYPGASTTSPFIAKEPYVINIQGKSVTIPLWGVPRKNDFSGNVPFVNPTTGKADPGQMVAWDPVFARSFTPYLSGDYNLNGNQITNKGFPGRVDKQTINGIPTTMTRYNAGNGTSIGCPRTQLNAYAIPPRTHVRWQFEVAFGNPDGRNDWNLTPSGTSPALFWQIHSTNQHNPPLAANVDTDSSDPSKLMITFMQRTGGATSPVSIGRIKGIPRHKTIPIVIDAFLDERSNSNGGKGLLQIYVNNALAIEKAGPTLAAGPNPHWWTFGVYLWNQKSAYNQTRAAFWKTAKMIVFPVGAANTPIGITPTTPTTPTTPPTTADTTAPSVPGNLAATSDSSKVNLTWSASTDNVGVAGYNIYRDGTKIGTSATTSYTDTSAVGGTASGGAIYNYTVKAYDAAGNISASSNTVKVDRASAISITSKWVSGIKATEAYVNWTTNVPSSGVVYYGTSATSMNSSVTFSNLSTNHAVRLAGLARGTTYYYKIVTKNSGGAIYNSFVASFRTLW